jgi:PAS domain S-box-containing protein
MADSARPLVRLPSPKAQKAAMWAAIAIILGVNLLAFVSIQQLLAASERLQASQLPRLDQQARVTSMALAVGVILCLAMIAWLFSLRGKEVDRSRESEGELRAHNLELEDRVQEPGAAVEKTQELLNAIVESLPDMIFLTDAEDDFRYVLVNAAGEALFGLDRSEILGRTDGELLDKAEAALFLADSREAAGAGRARIFSDRRMTTPAGIRIVESRKVPIASGDGAGQLMLGMVRDVTEARQMEEQLRQLMRMEAVGRLTGGVAHDFNNLLAIIQGNSELLRSLLVDGTEEAGMADDIAGAAQRGAELVRRLLAFARTQRLQPEAVDLNVRLHEVMGLLERALGEDIELKVRMAEHPWPATVDPTQVDDALVNLAINARDAMGDGGTLTIETANVTLDADYAASNIDVVPGDYVMLAVSDTGTGMTGEVLARAFEPFFTTKEEGRGTGLGLSQVFGWVKQSHGHIKIYSELGYGTAVKLYLPRAAGHIAGKGAEPVVSTPTGDETILVVEDNPNVRKTVIRQLHDLGYRTLEADGGAQALELVRSGAAFDMLLTDVVMPGGISGCQLADELRGDRPDLRVLFTSGYTQFAANGGQPLPSGMLLSKPYRKQELGLAIRATLDEKLAAVG